MSGGGSVGVSMGSATTYYTAGLGLGFGEKFFAEQRERQDFSILEAQG